MTARTPPPNARRTRSSSNIPRAVPENPLVPVDPEDPIASQSQTESDQFRYAAETGRMRAREEERSAREAAEVPRCTREEEEERQGARARMQKEEQRRREEEGERAAAVSERPHEGWSGGSDDDGDDDGFEEEEEEAKGINRKKIRSADEHDSRTTANAATANEPDPKLYGKAGGQWGTDAIAAPNAVATNDNTLPENDPYATDFTDSVDDDINHGGRRD
ncbi:hypothetical protein HK104_005868, partial [Borealophlyctis nickersoniae]